MEKAGETFGSRLRAAVRGIVSWGRRLLGRGRGAMAEADETCGWEGDARELPKGDRVVVDFLFKDSTLQWVTSDPGRNVATVLARSIDKRLGGDPGDPIVGAWVQRRYCTTAMQRRMMKLDLVGTTLRKNWKCFEFEARPDIRVLPYRGHNYGEAVRSWGLEKGMAHDAGPTVEVYFIGERLCYSKDKHPDLKGPVVRLYEVLADANPRIKTPAMRVAGEPEPTKIMICYVDGAYKANDDIGRMLHDVWCVRYDEILDPDMRTAMSVYLHPEDEEERKKMLGILEAGIKDIQDQYVAQSAELTRKDGLIATQGAELTAMSAEMTKKDDLIATQSAELTAMSAEIADLKRQLRRHGIS